MVGTLLLRSLADRRLAIGLGGLRWSATLGGTGAGSRSTNWSPDGARQRRCCNNDRQEKTASFPSESTLLFLLGERGGLLPPRSPLSTARIRAVAAARRRESAQALYTAAL